jgi:hypothetical protein
LAGPRRALLLAVCDQRSAKPHLLIADGGKAIEGTWSRLRERCP